MGTSAAGEATTTTSLQSWSLSMAADRVATPAMGDSNIQYVQGLPDCSGEFSAWWDDSFEGFYTAMVSGERLKMYLYPSSGATTKYHYGLAWVDMSIEASVDGAVTLTAGWGAAGDWAHITT